MEELKEEDILRYIYNEPLDEKIKRYINQELGNKNETVIQDIYQTALVKKELGFKSYKEHLSWYKQSKDKTLKIVKKELAFDNKKTSNTFRYVFIGSLIIVLGVALYFTTFQSNSVPIEEEEIETLPIASILEEELKTFPKIALIGKTRSSGDNILNKIHEFIYIQKDYKSAIEKILNEIKKGGKNENIFQYIMGLSYLRMGDIENSIRYLRMVENDSNSIYQLDAKEQLIYAFTKNEQYDKATILIKELKKIEDYKEKMELIEISLAKYRKDFR